MKSFKKFPAPMKRLEMIACDAELQEKSLAELHKLGTYLREQCEIAMNEANATEPAQPEKSEHSCPQSSASDSMVYTY